MNRNDSLRWEVLERLIGLLGHDPQHRNAANLGYVLQLQLADLIRPRGVHQVNQ